jgi:predicted SAM-dependent methyltransferase
VLTTSSASREDPMVASQGEPGARRLHIGGRRRAEGWEIMDAIARSEVDHVGDAADLSRFADATFAQLYASHVLEHFDYAGPLDATLREWHRVLEPGGRLHLSVPDLATCCRLFVDPTLNVDERFHVVRIIFGGHVDSSDYHQNGFDEALLRVWIARAGFKEVDRVDDLGLFDDTSRLRFRGVPISLNVIARKAGAAVLR